MDQLSTTTSGHNDHNPHVGSTNSKEIHNCSVCSSKRAAKCLESLLVLVTKPPPQLTTTDGSIQVISDKGGGELFQCKLCRKIFKRLGHTRRHVLAHSGEKPYCCRVCNKRFPRSDYLLTHIRKHKTDTLHSCCVCSKTFYGWRDFIYHCLTHNTSEYDNIASKVKEVPSKRHFKSSPTKQDSLQKKAQLPRYSSNGIAKTPPPQQLPSDNEAESLFYQATISSPVYSSNCKPLSDYIQYNTIPHSSSTPCMYNVQYSPYLDLSLPQQPLYHQSQPSISQSSLQDNFNQPPDLIHIPPLEPINSGLSNCITAIPGQCYPNISPTIDYESHKMIYYEEQQSSLQPDYMMQPPHLIPMPPLVPIHT